MFSIYDFVVHMTFCDQIFQLKLLYFDTYHYCEITMILDMHPHVFLTDGYSCCKGWLKLKISSFFKTQNSFCFASKSYQYSSKLPWFHLTPMILPEGSSVSPLLAAYSRCRTGRGPPGASRQCSNPDWSARHAASSIVPLQALTEALQSESVLLPVGKPMRVCLCVSLYVSKHP